MLELACTQYGKDKLEMKIQELLTEAREAPLYHFTQEGSFFRILKTNVLYSPGGKIYFTRDYSRQFSPKNPFKGTWGFRIDQDKLRQKYGRKLQAGGQNAMSDKERQAWLNDPANADAIEKVKRGEKGGATYNGYSIDDVVRGTMGASKRWESEEWLLTDKLENLDQYISGIVYAGGKHGEGMGRDQEFRKRRVQADDALTDLAKHLMGHWRDKSEWKLRDVLFDYMTERNIPFVYQRQDFPARQVKSKMVELWRERKADRELRSKEDGVMWIVKPVDVNRRYTLKAPAGDPVFAAKRALMDKPDIYPNGIESIEQGNNVYQFEEPYKDPKTEPKLKKSP